MDKVHKLIKEYRGKIEECDQKFSLLVMDKRTARREQNESRIKEITLEWYGLSKQRQAYVQIIADLESLL